MIRKALLGVCLVLSSLVASAQQVAVKTNALYWATATPNIGLEASVGKQHTVQLFYGLNPWKQSDGRLQVYEKQTGNTVADMNLPALLSRLRVRAEGSGYSEQEFLDRACDYEVEVWLRGGRPEYVDLGISDFGWSVRINYDEL